MFNGGSEAVKHITEWEFVPLFYISRLWLSLRLGGFLVARVKLMKSFEVIGLVFSFKKQKIFVKCYDKE